jgi:transposase-like protein
VEARALGRGGVSAVARATGVSRTTVSKAVRELDESEADGEEGPLPVGRARRSGAGRPRLTDRDPGLADALEGRGPDDARGSAVAVAVDVEVDA